MPRLPSGFVTDRVYRLRREGGAGELTWTLTEHALPQPYRKVYDDGDVDDWLESYVAGSSNDRFRFLAAYVNDQVAGLLTWEPVEWNNTIWLIDIRVREEFRRHGAGSALLVWLEREADRRGTRGIWLETQINNVPAIRFYRSRGFDIAGFNDHLYSNDDVERQDIALYMFQERRPLP